MQTPTPPGRKMLEYTVNLLRDDAAAEIVASWQYTEWGEGYEGTTPSDFLYEVRKSIGSRTLPVVFVANLNGEVIGTASLIVDDLPSRLDLNPWLASIFVRPAWRKRGVATELIHKAIAHAESLSLGTLYLFTHDLEAFYRKFAFRKADVSEFMGQPVTIMVRDLRARSVWVSTG